MESAVELHEARVLRARIEMREAELGSLRGDAPSADGTRLAEEITKEIERLKDDYRRVLARQADEDYCRRRDEWRAQQGGRRRTGPRPACACA